MAKDKEGLSVDEKFELLLEALTRQQTPGIDMNALKEVLTATQLATAGAMQKAMKPENPDHPDVSVFNKPGGNRDNPKAVLPFEFWYVGYPVHLFPETEHWRELELMAQVKPGEYTVIRKDGTPMAVTVKGERDANGVTTKLMVEFSVSREDKWLIPPKSVLIYQLVYNDHPKRRFLEAMQEHLTLTMGEPVGA